MSTTNDDALVARLVPKILSAIRAKATAVETIPVKNTLSGITSIPCYDTSGGQYRKVLLSMASLSDLTIQLSNESLIAVDGIRQENEKVRIANENQRIANEKERGEQFQIWADHGVNHPKIGENGNWWSWSEAEGKYIDSGVLAQGGIFLPTLAVNDAMELTFTSGNPNFGEFAYDEGTGELLFVRQ